MASSGLRTGARGARSARAWRNPRVRFLDELFSRMPENSVVVTDVGQHQMWAAQRYRSSSPRGFITSGGLGCDGLRIAGSGRRADWRIPIRCVLCVSGDGGFQMNIQELATVHRLGLPIKNGDHRQQISWHGAAVAAAFLCAQLCRDRFERQSGFCGDRRRLTRFTPRGWEKTRCASFRCRQETGDAMERFPALAGAGVTGFRLPARSECLSDGSCGSGAVGDVV